MVNEEKEASTIFPRPVFSDGCVIGDGWCFGFICEFAFLNSNDEVVMCECVVSNFVYGVLDSICVELQDV